MGDDYKLLSCLSGHFHSYWRGKGKHKPDCSRWRMVV